MFFFSSYIGRLWDSYNHPDKQGHWPKKKRRAFVALLFEINGVLFAVLKRRART
jgi:hypothetical protein